MKFWHKLSWRWKERVKISAFVTFIVVTLVGAQLMAGEPAVRCASIPEATHDRG